jgi:glutamate dehydrogenase/leucine dehydrogenase
VLLGSFEEVAEHLLRCVQQLHARRLLTLEVDALVPATSATQLQVKPQCAKSPEVKRLVGSAELPKMPLEEEEEEARQEEARQAAVAAQAQVAKRPSATAKARISRRRYPSARE